MTRSFIFLILLLIGLNSVPVGGQGTATPASELLTTYREALAFAGPGASFRQVGVLGAGIPVMLTERNLPGTWVRAVHAGLEGWIITGYLNLPDAYPLGDLPVTMLAAGDPANAEAGSLRELYAAPLLHTGDRFRDIYALGAWRGIDPTAITKIGDSLSADSLFLEPLARPDAVDHLGAFGHLADVIGTYGPSVGVSAAARVGMTSYVVFDPMWADSDLCQPGETPLACELNRTRPAIAFILFGPNDVMRMTADEFAVQMRLIVDDVMAAGTIPVLSTFSYRPDAELWWQSVDFNRAIVALAAEADLPLIHLWLAARTLPDYGLDGDGVHLLQSGYPHLMFEDGVYAWRGAALRNLLVVSMLDTLHAGLLAD